MRDVKAGTDRVTAVVLAAGAGSRFGGGKLLAPLEGRPILQHVIDRLAASGLDDVVVVLGDDAADVERSIDWHGARRIRNPDPSRGLSSSLQHGIEALAPGVDAALIVLADQPRLPPRAIRALLDAEVDPSATDRRPRLWRRHRPQPGPPRAGGVRTGRRHGRRPRPGPAYRRKSGSRPGDPDPGRGRQSRRRHARRPDRIAGECLGRARPGECRAGRSLPRSPRRR